MTKKVKSQKSKVKSFKKILCLTLLTFHFLLLTLFGCGGCGGGDGAKYGSLTINSYPQNADIHFDGNYTGLTTPNTISNISVGTHTVKLTKNLYKPWEKQVVISANQTTVIKKGEAILEPDEPPQLPSKVKKND